MQTLAASTCASISELKKNPSGLIASAEGAPIVILNHNHPTAYLIPAETFEAYMELIDDAHLGMMVKERQREKDQAVEISLDDL